MSNDPRNPKIIETASGTTSPDNANSGPFAYIIAAVAFVFVVAFSLITAGCTSFVFTNFAEEYENELYGSNAAPYGYDYDYPYDYDLENFDFDQFLEQYGVPNEGTTSTTGATGSETTAADDVLDFDLAIYGDTIDAQVSASAYAGVSSDVREYVRGMLRVDKEYTERVVSCLNAAAADPDARTDRLAEAQDICGEATEALTDLNLPELEKDDNGTVKDLLGSAKVKAADRYEAIQAEVALIAQDDVDKDRLWELDGKVAETTEEAAGLVLDALTASANN